MDFKTFLENFDAIAEAPGGIPKLRSLILDLAMRGKLVPQNPEDDPAFELIEKVRFTKKHLINDKKIPKPKNLDSIKDSDLPYEIPQEWLWVRLGEITKLLEYGTSEKASEVRDDVPVFRMNNIQNGKLLFDNFKYVSQSIKDLPKLYLQNGDLLFNRTNSYELVGKTGLFRGESNCYTFASYLIRISLFSEYISSEFVNLVINSSYFQQTQIRPEIVQQCGQANFNGTKLQNTLIPLPPLAEQKRIVEKVDELMGLCDRYEAAKKTRDNLRQKLRGSAIASLMNAETDEELDVAWAFVRNNWHNLSQYPEDVNSLRQSALKLAFQGRLTQQFTETPSASELLKAIQEEQEEPVTKKNSRKKNTLDPLNCPGIFDVPQAWKWTYLDFVCEQIGDIDHKMPTAVTQGVPFLSAKDLKDDGTLDFSDPKYISEEDYERLSRKIKPRKGDIIYSRIGAKLGKARLVEVNTTFLISYSCCLIRPKYQFINVKYLRYFLDSKLALEQAISSTQSIGVPDLGLGAIKQYKIPYPPLGEQKRIVAKVDELMQLCDQLEASLRQSQQRAESLAASAINHLTI